MFTVCDLVVTIKNGEAKTNKLKLTSYESFRALTMQGERFLIKVLLANRSVFPGRETAARHVAGERTVETMSEF
jgi:hypothetical protein